MRRREFITLLGGATVWPLATSAQPRGTPVVGFLSGLSPDDRPVLTEMFRRGLSELGYVAGQNVTIEYRYAENKPERLQTLIADLMAHHVTVIAATGGNIVALTAKAATSTIPVVFTTGTDPVLAGLVTNINRPEGNVTGVSWFAADLGPKHLELARDLVAGATRIAVLINPQNQESALYEKPFKEAAARFPDLQLVVLKGSTAGQIDAAFEQAVDQRVDAMIVAGDPFFTARATQFAVLAAFKKIPVLYSNREITSAGGLISYGNDVPDAYRRAGIYAGRILNGVNPSSLPIDRATKFALVINLQTAKTLKLDVPAKLLSLADEVLE
jgi:putative tryptophan/tyrosine transport system substrate-binding protein